MSVPAKFGNHPGYHIQRPEVQQLVDWVRRPLPDNEVPDNHSSQITQRSKIVIGAAGTGKTVLLQDVYYSLKEKNIPVLALKADRVMDSSKGKLLEREAVH